jgi:PEP-CTERM motif
MLKKVLLTTTALLALSVLPAKAATTLHLSNTGTADNPVIDPAFLSSNTQFFVDNVSNGQTSTGPTDLFFLRPAGSAAPTISSVLFDGTTAVSFSVPTLLNLTFNSSSHDLYTLVGLGAGNNSINWSNVSAAFISQFGGVPASFNVYESIVQTGFGGNDFIQVNGSFPAGTVIVPFSAPDLFTSWTNTGVTTGDPTPAVPEPSTWAMMLLGFAGVGLFAMRKRREGHPFRLA